MNAKLQQTWHKLDMHEYQMNQMVFAALIVTIQIGYDYICYQALPIEDTIKKPP